MGRVYNYFKHKWEDEFENEAIRVKKIFKSYDNSYACKTGNFYLKKERYSKSSIDNKHNIEKKDFNHQVVFKISSSCKSYEHLASHIKYITRDGTLELICYEGDKSINFDMANRYRGKSQNNIALEKMDSNYRLKRNIDLSESHRENKETFNMIFSMNNYEVASTDQIKQACFNTIKELYPNHNFIIASHNDTDNPHCHLILKRTNNINGKKLRISKSDLAKIRIKYAENLRNTGVENAFTKDVNYDDIKPKFEKKWSKNHHYLITDFGKDYYDFNPNNSISYYVKYKTTKDKEAIIWGKDLERVVKENRLKKYDLVRFAITDQSERKRVIYKYDKETKTQKCYEATIYEKIWDCSLYRDENGNKIDKELIPLKEFKKNTYKEIKQNIPQKPNNHKYTYKKDSIFDKDFVISYKNIYTEMKADKREHDERIRNKDYRYKPADIGWTIRSFANNHYTKSEMEQNIELFFEEHKKDIDIIDSNNSTPFYNPTLFKFKGFEIKLLKDTDNKNNSYTLYMKNDHKSYMLGTISPQVFQDTPLISLLKEVNDEISNERYLDKEINLTLQRSVNNFTYDMTYNYINSDIINEYSKSKEIKPIKLSSLEKDKEHNKNRDLEIKQIQQDKYIKAKKYLKEIETSQKRKRLIEIKKNYEYINGKFKPTLKKPISKSEFNKPIYKNTIRNLYGEQNNTRDRSNKYSRATIQSRDELYITSLAISKPKRTTDLARLTGANANPVRSMSKFDMDTRREQSNMLLPNDAHHQLQSSRQSQDNRDMRLPDTSHQGTQADNRVDIDNNQNKINSININQTNKNQQSIYQSPKPINQSIPSSVNKSKNKGNEMEI